MQENFSLYLALTGVILAVLVLLWVLLGPGGRRRRQLARARKLLHEGNWEAALIIGDTLQRNRLSPRWEKRVRDLLADCHQAAGRELLRKKQFEKALEALQKATELRVGDQAEARAAVIAAMLEEIRRLFATTPGADTAPVQEMIGRTLLLDQKCAEAYFWQALCFIRENKTEQAVLTLRRLVDGTDGSSDWTFFSVPQSPAERFIDPPLYLGALLLRQGQPREALRYLTEANRSDGNCPVVVCLLGMAMIAAGGDVSFALRALQRPLGPRGFATWAATPERVWVEGFPDQRSYVRRLASKHPYPCPLFGKDYTLLQRQGNIALAEGHYRLGQFEQAVNLFDRLLHESAPSVEILRGLGLALVRLERYDQAFKHLRMAHELEEPKTHRTAGYLALCGARGKPASPEDKVNNIAWAVWLVRGFQVHGDAEWVQLLNDIFAEARSCGVGMDLADQLHLCEHLLSISAVDPLAAEAYHQLAATHPEALRPEFAWLYCRAAHQHGHQGICSLDLFARTFQDQDQARQFFAARGWDLDELEFPFLERAAAEQPGRFPEVLGPDYPVRGEKMLLERAAQFQHAQDLAAAAQSLEVLVGLAPHHTAAQDRLAQLHYQMGHLDRAIELLRQWQEREPAAAMPLIRLAILHQQKDEPAEAQGCIHQALEKTDGQQRADVAFLGARLALAQAISSAPRGEVAACGEADNAAWNNCIELLNLCLEADPHHIQANWCLAALAALSGDDERLKQQAAAMNRPDVPDVRFHYLAALCHLAAGNFESLNEACERAAVDEALRTECDFVRGWAALYHQDVATATSHFQKVAAGSGPSAQYARALLGGLHYFQGHYDQAVENWKALEPQACEKLGLQQPLGNMVWLSALQALEQEDYQKAVIRIREAGRLGVKDRRLGPLLTLALQRAGQRLLYSDSPAL